MTTPHAPDYRPLAGNDDLTCATCYESWPCETERQRRRQDALTDRHIATPTGVAEAQQSRPMHVTNHHEGDAR